MSATSPRTRPWNEVTFADIVEDSAFGPRFSGDAYTDDGNIATLRTTDISEDGRISHQTMPLAQLDEAKFAKHFLKAGDLVITRSGRVGTTAIFDSYHQPVLPGAFLIRFRLREGASPQFFRYWFNSRTGQQRLLSVARGAAQQNINITNVKRLNVPLPPITLQRDIASILSAYDDLIENNRRRIQLLEQAARLLYKEWFVHLRFPGHEHLTITDGVPEGWEKKKLGEVLLELESGSRPKGGAQEDGVPSVGAENIIGIGQYDYSKEKYVPETYFNSMRQGIIQSRDVLVYKDGANIGRSSYFGDGFPHERCAVNEHVFILRASPEVGQDLLYFWVERDETRQRIANLNANTAQPGVSKSKLKTLDFVVPKDRIASMFNEAVEPIVRQICLLAKEERGLITARNLLLPRLMNGEMAV